MIFFRVSGLNLLMNVKEEGGQLYSPPPFTRLWFWLLYFNTVIIGLGYKGTACNNTKGRPRLTPTYVFDVLTSEFLDTVGMLQKKIRIAVEKSSFFEWRQSTKS